MPAADLENSMKVLARALERHTRVDGVHDTALAGLRVIRFSSPSEPTPSVLEPSLCLIAQGRKRTFIGRELYRYDPAHYLVASADLAVLAQVTHATPREPYLSLQMQFDEVMASELLATLPAQPRPPPSRAAATARIDEGLLDAVMRLVDLLDAPDHLPFLAPLIQREITYRLLVGPEGDRFRQVITADSHARHVSRAIVWLREHFAENLRVDSLARKVGMSASTFHHHFKTVTGMSPLQYQKRLRLQEARRLLLAERLDAAEASFRVGYESPSQFSREYRRLFGAPPRRDVAALDTQTVEMRTS